MPEVESHEISSIFYNHKNDAAFCAPNSLYIQINSIMYNYTKNEVISLDYIARFIGYTTHMGSQIDDGHLSKLSNRINKIINQGKRQTLKIKLTAIRYTEFQKLIKKHPKN